jgi:ankyrin repeat protein
MHKRFIAFLMLTSNFTTAWTMEQSSIDHLSSLPRDMKLVIISYLTSPNDMLSLLLANKQLAVLLKEPSTLGTLITEVAAEKNNYYSMSSSIWRYNFDNSYKHKICLALRIKTDTAVAWLKEYLGKDELAKECAESLLFGAIDQGNLEIVAFLIQSGIDTNCKDYDKIHLDYETPLTAAILSQVENKLSIIDLLIQNKADLNATTGRHEHFPLFDAVNILNEEENAPTKYKKSAKELVPQIVQTLTEAGANVNAQVSHGSTSLSWLCFLLLAKLCKEPDIAKEVIKILLQAGADINIKNMHGQSALNYSSGMPWLSSRKILKLFKSYNHKL